MSSKNEAVRDANSAAGAPAPEWGEMASRIRAAHRAVEEAQRGCLQRVRDAGALLNRAKERVSAAGQGWEEWVKANCQFALRVAQRYMSIATRYEELEDSGADLIELSLRGAEALLSKGGEGARKAVELKPIVVTATELKQLRSGAMPRPKLRPDSPEQKFVVAQVERLRRQVLARARKGKLQGKSGAPVPPALLAATLCEAIRGGLELKWVVQVGKAAAPKGAKAPGKAARTKGTKQHKKVQARGHVSSR